MDFWEFIKYCFSCMWNGLTYLSGYPPNEGMSMMDNIVGGITFLVLSVFILSIFIFIRWLIYKNR